METHPGPDQSLEITCILRRRNEISGAPELKLSHEELTQMHGADPADIKAVEAFAAMHCLSVIRVNAGTRTIVLAGTQGLLATAFGTDMEGNLRIPESITDKVMAVLGFYERSRVSSYQQQAKSRPHWFFT
jgi:kumamolisin